MSRRRNLEPLTEEQKQLAADNVPLAKWAAKRIRMRQNMELVPLDDLISACYEGLCKAARKYDPKRGIKFSHYAMHWMRQECERERQSMRLVHIPYNHIAKEASSGKETPRAHEAAKKAMEAETLSASNGDVFASSVPLPHHAIERRESAMVACQRWDHASCILNAKEITALVHVFVEGKSRISLSRELGVSHQTINSRVARAISKARGMIPGYVFVEGAA